MPNPLANELVNLTKPGLDEHDKRRKRYDDSYSVYRALNPSGKAEPWQSKLRVPYGMQVIDTALVNIVTGKPRVRVRPRNPGGEQQARAMEQVLAYFMDEDHFVEKLPAFVQQGLIFGVTVAKNHWLYETCVKPGRQAQKNPMTGQSVMVPTGPQEYVERDGPTFEPWDVYDAWWDPDGRDVDTARYVVLRSWVSKDDLLRLAVNEDRGTGIYHNVDELIKAGAKQQESTSRQQQRNNAEKRKDKFELWEIWRDTPQGLRLTVLGNRTIVLRDSPSPYWHAKKPVVIAQVRPDLFEIAGIPETELVDHLQQALWTVQNMRVDNLHLTVMRGFTYREGGVTDPNALELRPRFKWPVQDHDDVQFQAPPPLPPEAYREDDKMLAQMQLVTGINPFVSGSDMQGVDQNTATGVTALQEVASRLLRFKAAQIQNKAYQRTYEQWAEMAMQLMDSEVAIRIEGPGNQFSWETFGPEEIIGSYDIIVEGTEESLSRQQERSEAIALLNAFAPFAQLGVNLKPIFERIAASYDMPPESLFQTPAAPAAPAAPGANGMAGPEAPQQLLGGQQMNPLVAQAIQQGG